MTMTIDPLARRATSTSPSTALRTCFAAVRVSFMWLGVRKSLSADQKAQAAESFGAEGQFLSAAKKLLDTRDPAYKAVTSIRTRMQNHWRATSLPYPEPGLRLIRQGQIEQFDRQMQGMRQELAEAVEELDERYAELKAAAKERLGSLYDPAGYPVTLKGLFQVEWDFPSVEPPDYLQRLNPDLYEQERQRIAARFEEAVVLAEQAFAAEFGKLVSHLVERLSGEGGDKKVFRDSAVTNLVEFFERFRQLNVHSNEDLDRMVESAQRAIRGVEAQDLRDNSELRQHIASQLSSVHAGLDQIMVDQPRRRILRPGRGEG